MRIPHNWSDIEMYINDNESVFHDNTTSSLLGNETLEENYNADDPDSAMFCAGARNTTRGVFLVIFVFLGAVLNIFMIVAIVPNRRLRTVRNILLVHLGVCGLVLSLSVSFVTAVVSFSGKWFGESHMCQVYGYVTSVLTLVTAWTIAALSWDKYQTIVSPLHHSLTAIARKMVACFAIFWMFACILSLPPLLGASRFRFHPQKGICFICTNSTLGKAYVIVYIVMAFYLPLAIMVYCYTHIFRIARTQSSRIAATMIRMTCVIQAPITPSSQAKNLSIKGTKAMRTIFQLVGAFVLTYIPLSVILLIEISSNTFKGNTVLTSTSTMLFFSAPVVNSVVYGLRNKILRASFHRYVRRKIRYWCYKDKRKNSIKSFRSSSFKTAMLHRRSQNGGPPGLRRTQSFPVRGSRAARTCSQNAKDETEIKNGGLLLTPKDKCLTRPHSFNVLNGSCLPIPEESVVAPICNGNLKPMPEAEDDDMLQMTVNVPNTDANETDV